MSQKKHVAGLLLTATLLGAAAVGVGLFGPRDRMLTGYYRVSVGIPQARLLDLLGPADPGDPPVDPVGETVLHWTDADARTGLVVWLDPAGNVVETMYTRTDAAGTQWSGDPALIAWRRLLLGLGF